jgi:hypothetical protein
MIKILKYSLPILIPSILVSLCLIPSDTEKQNQLLSVVAAVGTLGALLFLIFDKLQREGDERQQFWHDHLPYVTLSSPCDPTQNRCDIDIQTNFDPYNDRGARYFSIVNFSNANAYDINVDICTTSDFCNSPVRSHYIDFLPVYSEPAFEGSDPNGLKFIYSKYHINPITKEVLLDEFDLCNFIQNCNIVRGLKTVYVKLTYHSSPVTTIVKKIKSVFKVDLECGEVDPGHRFVKINNIILIKYDANI